MQLKEEAMQRFKRACASLANHRKREMAVATQYSRNIWELHDSDGLIKIKNENPPTIAVYRTCGYVEANNYTVDNMYTRILTQQEYEELESLFFGHYSADSDYLQKLGVVVDEYRKAKK